MKKIIIRNIIYTKNIYRAIKLANRGRFKYKPGSRNWSTYLHRNVNLLRYDILKGKYKVRSYAKFKISDTKERIIHAPAYRDKLVQYMLNNIIRDVYERSFIKDSYACIRGRGPQAALLTLRKYILKAYSEYEEPMLVKIDIKKFFYSINRSILFNVLCKKIKCVETRMLIIEKLKFNESITGLPLGNLTSQQFANILLNELDQYIKRALKVKYYVRYADDMFILVNTKEYGKLVLTNIKSYVKDVLGLECNSNKCYIKRPDKIIALGHIIDKYGTITILGRNVRKFYKIFKIKYVSDKSLHSVLKKQYHPSKKSNMRPATMEDIVARLNSWYGHFKLAKVHGIIKKGIRLYGKNLIQFDKELNKFILITS